MISVPEIKERKKLEVEVVQPQQGRKQEGRRCENVDIEAGTGEATLEGR